MSRTKQILTMVSLVFLCSCSTFRYSSGPDSAGFSAIQVALKEYQVKYVGNSFDNLKDVEKFLIDGCSKLALSQGFVYFSFKKASDRAPANAAMMGAMTTANNSAIFSANSAMFSANSAANSASTSSSFFWQRQSHSIERIIVLHNNLLPDSYSVSRVMLENDYSPYKEPQAQPAFASTKKNEAEKIKNGMSALEVGKILGTPYKISNNNSKGFIGHFKKDDKEDYVILFLKKGEAFTVGGVKKVVR